MRDAPLLLTEAEAAARLRLSARVLRQARQDGALRFILRGRSVRYTIADLESYIDHLRQAPIQCTAPRPTSAKKARSAGRGAVIVPFKARNTGR